MVYSSLAECLIESPNTYGKRKHSITRITPHVFVGQVTAERAAEYFRTAKNKSANYVIGNYGKIICVVPEDKAAMTSSNSDNDHRSITIEIASDTKEPYGISNDAFNSLRDLIADIASRYGMCVMPTRTIEAAKLAEQNGNIALTMHRWFAAKACPGQYLIDRWEQLAVNREDMDTTTGPLYKVQVGAFRNRSNASRVAMSLKEKGYDVFIVNC